MRGGWSWPCPTPFCQIIAFNGPVAPIQMPPAMRGLHRTAFATRRPCTPLAFICLASGWVLPSPLPTAGSFNNCFVTLLMCVTSLPAATPFSLSFHTRELGVEGN